MKSIYEITAKRPQTPAAAALLASLFALSACAPVTPHWDDQFGKSVKFAVAQQTANPEASRNTDPVTGIDGRAAAESIKRYQDSFREPPPPAPLIQITNTGGGN